MDNPRILQALLCAQAVTDLTEMVRDGREEDAEAAAKEMARNIGLDPREAMQKAKRAA